jgi:hypothetical protein
MALDFNALLALNALVIMKETETITYGTRVASREKTGVIAPETSAVVKDATLSVQEAKMRQRWDKMLIVYDERKNAAW